MFKRIFRICLNAVKGLQIEEFASLGTGVFDIILSRVPEIKL